MCCSIRDLPQADVIRATVATARQWSGLCLGHDCSGTAIQHTQIDGYFLFDMLRVSGALAGVDAG